MENNNNPEENRALNQLMIPGAIILAGIIIAVAVIYSGPARPYADNKDGAKVEVGAAPIGKNEQKSLEGDGPFLGNPSAKIVIVEFGDFQCPFCGRFFQTTEKEIIEKYVKIGKAKFVYRDFAFLGPESEWAAEASHCADEQGKFWQYHDYLYSRQNGENEGAFSKENLKSFAEAIGLDTAKFGSCLDSEKYLDKVRKSTEDGRKFGVSGTPANFVNGKIITGAVPFAQFEALIEEELAK